MRFLPAIILLAATLHAGTPEKIVTAARAQIGVTMGYDPAYVKLAYPNGDVPQDRGVCTDVVIRALRRGLAQDLQQLVHDDMRRNFAAYPKQWGLTKTDANIDHRRVPNLRAYFKRRGLQLPLPAAGDFSAYQAGDFVTCTVPPHLPHIMIVSDRRSPQGRPLVIHNIGGGTQEEDILADYPITGHYRWK